VPGSKGARAYAWAWLGTASQDHYLLIRRHLATGEPAYHYCHVPPGRPVTVMTLVRVACLRWPVEEDCEFGKDHFGLDHSPVRLYTALLRHIVLTMVAVAVCAVTAAHAKAQAPPPILPIRPDQQPPADTGLIAVTVAEVKRLFILWLPANSGRWSITCVGSCGDDAARPVPGGSITAPDSAEKQQPHDVIKVRLE
jgi:hypothetical protein